MNTVALVSGGDVRIDIEDNVWFNAERTRLAERLIPKRRPGRCSRGKRIQTGKVEENVHLKGSKKEKFGELFRHGLVLEAVLERLKKIGIEINFLSFFKEDIKEGLGAGFAARFKAYEVGPLSPEDMESIATQRGWRDAAYYRSELAAGKLCFGAKLDNQLASFTWVNLKDCKYSRIIRPLKDKQAYMYDSYTFPAFRGLGLAPFVRNECYKALDQMGIKTLYSVASYFNKPAIAFKKKLGATFLRIEIQIILFKKFRWFFTKNHKN